MKRFLITLFYAAIDAAGGGTTLEPVELTSEKLTALKTAYLAAYAEQLKFPDPFSKESKDARMATFRIENEISAEENAIRKAANDAKNAEARNNRLALNSNQLSAYSEFLKVSADKKSTPEQVETAKMAFDTAKEVVENELLAKFVGSKPAKKSDDATGSKSSDSAAIVELYAAGKSHKEIEGEGYARSTVWHAINNAIIAGTVTKR